MCSVFNLFYAVELLYCTISAGHVQFLYPFSYACLTLTNFLHPSKAQIAVHYQSGISHSDSELLVLLLSVIQGKVGRSASARHDITTNKQDVLAVLATHTHNCVRYIFIKSELGTYQVDLLLPFYLQYKLVFCLSFC